HCISPFLYFKNCKTSLNVKVNFKARGNLDKNGNGTKGKANVNAHSDPAVSTRECKRSVKPIIKESSHKFF
ncbi:MAG: hypothetical protein WBA30_16260, partial [Priestia megaterium]